MSAYVSKPSSAVRDYEPGMSVLFSAAGAIYRDISTATLLIRHAFPIMPIPCRHLLRIRGTDVPFVFDQETRHSSFPQDIINELITFRKSCGKIIFSNILRVRFISVHAPGGAVDLRAVSSIHTLSRRLG